MAQQFSQSNLFLAGIHPNADLYNGDPASQVVLMSMYERATFILNEGAGGAGTATLTIEAVDNVAGDNPVAIPFRYKLNTVGDTWTDWLAATAAGYLTIAGANKKVLIEVRDAELPDGKSGSRLKLAEAANFPVVGGVDIIMGKAKHRAAVMPTAIA